MLVNGHPFTVVGVAPPGFHSMVWGRVPSLYVPITMQRIIEPEWTYLSDHRSYWLNVVGRLRDNETREQALANIGPLWTALRTNEFPLQRDQSEKRREEFITKSHLNLDAGAKGFSPYRDEFRTPLLIMMGMMLLVISMAIVNVASLLLVRASARVREFSMRYALGATNLQVLRQLIAEGLLLGISGAVAGLVLATPALRCADCMDCRTYIADGILRPARLAGANVHDEPCAGGKPAVQPCSGAAVLEPEARRCAAAAGRHGQWSVREVSPHLRCTAGWLKPDAGDWRGRVHAYD